MFIVRTSSSVSAGSSLGAQLIKEKELYEKKMDVSVGMWDGSGHIDKANAEHKNEDT